MNNIKISQTQARSFAVNIFKDIRSYIEKHQHEYKIFLEEEIQEQKHKDHVS